MLDFRLNQVSIKETENAGKRCFRVEMPSAFYQDPTKEALRDRDFMAWKAVDFRDGTIELDVLSDLASDAPPYARGFIGLAFRIDEHMQFENIYLRPTNSRVDDQVRRNRTIQYAAYPDFTFPRLREEEPGKYETYADIPIGEWIHLKFDIHGTTAKLYLNHSIFPAMVVNDLKLGAEHSGGIGLWIESGTIGYFANLTITNK